MRPALGRAGLLDVAALTITATVQSRSALVERRQFRCRPGETIGAGRRVRMRQEHDRPRRPGTAPRRRSASGGSIVFAGKTARRPPAYRAVRGGPRIRPPGCTRAAWTRRHTVGSHLTEVIALHGLSTDGNDGRAQSNYCTGEAPRRRPCAAPPTRTSSPAAWRSASTSRSHSPAGRAADRRRAHHCLDVTVQAEILRLLRELRTPPAWRS